MATEAHIQVTGIVDICVIRVANIQIIIGDSSAQTRITQTQQIVCVLGIGFRMVIPHGISMMHREAGAAADGGVMCVAGVGTEMTDSQTNSMVVNKGVRIIWECGVNAQSGGDRKGY
jgi:hypothetical protein